VTRNSQNISLNYNSTTHGVVTIVNVGMNQATLVTLSTTTKMLSKPFWPSKNPQGNPWK
jgi:hypothetical protein